MKHLTYATVCSGIECMSAACADLPLKPVFFSEIEPFPCAVLKAHYPNVPNLGDMSKIQATNNGLTISNGKSIINLEKNLDILAGGTPCFVAGTMVLTPKGYVPIETLKVGDEVISGSGRIQNVEAVGSKMAKVGKLKILGRPEITCTPNHPFFCVDMKRDNCRTSATYSQIIPIGDYAVTRADKSVGKYVGRINKENAPSCDVAFPKCGNATSKDIMELAGWYLGDGYIRRFKGKTKKSVIFALCCDKKIEQFKSRFVDIVNICESKDGKLVINCTALANWLIENFGEHSASKYIPYWCYGHSDIDFLLRGYSATDGWIQGNEQKYCTISPALAYGIADLIGNASVYLQEVPQKGMIQGREINQSNYYQVKITPKTIRTRYINGRYASIVRSYNGTDGAIQRVYNITVSEEHTYIANGIYTHNCQDVSNAGLRRGMQEGSGTRSSLAFEFVRLIRELKPKFVLWENVAGVLSDPSFPEFLQQIAKCGYAVAYRTLDAQWVRCEDIHHEDGRVVGMERAIPQRRRRVWVIGHIGADVGKVAEILFEHKGITGDTPPSRRTGKEVARTARGSNPLHDSVVGGTPRDDERVAVCDEQMFCKCRTDGVIDTMKASQYKEPQCVAQIQKCEGFFDNVRNGFPTTGEDVNHTVCSASRYQGVVEQCVALEGNGSRPSHRGDGASVEGVSYTLNAVEQHQVAYGVDNNSVVECYKLDSTASNSMKSNNPHSGIHKAEVSACLDTTIPEPSKAQGGNVVVECYENHAQDSRVKPVDTANTLGANNGDCLQGKSNLVCFATPQLHDTTSGYGENLSPTISAAAGESGNNRPFVCDKAVIYNKVTHAKGKDGEGERWEAGEIASTRNVFDVGETRTQECVVHGVVSHQPATEVLDLQGGKIGAHYTDDGTAPTLTYGRGSASDIHAVTMVNKEAE